MLTQCLTLDVDEEDSWISVPDCIIETGFYHHTSAHIKQSQRRDSAQLIPDSRGGRTWPGPDIIEYSQEKREYWFWPNGVKIYIVIGQFANSNDRDYENRELLSVTKREK